MITPETRRRYQPTIGIECHVQLKTKTKLFAAVDNDARDAAPNTLVSHICFGLPGALPVLNREAIRLVSKAAFALGTTPARFSKFDRKHYFYPDLPKGYQITQYDEPLITTGSIELEIDGATKTIGITRAHLEEDAGKSTHPIGKDYSLVDLNRAGTPLLEIVSEPDIHSPAEAKAYAHELYLRMKYAGVSDCDLYLGHMRFDVNVSVSQDQTKRGIRTETKNLNSFRSVEKAVEYEINRQIELLEKGKPVVQETRGWDDAKQCTFTQRTKEEAHDYRYMPDPDLPPVVLSDEYIEDIRLSMPILPDQWRKQLKKLGLSPAAIETLLDAEVEGGQAGYVSVLKALMDQPKAATFTANRIINIEIPLRREGQLAKAIPDTEKARLYLGLYRLSQEGKINSSREKELLALVLSQEELPPDIAQFAHKNGFVQVSDEDEIAGIVAQVLDENPKAADDIKNGELKAIGFLVGQIMKASQGKVNPSIAQELIKKQLSLQEE